LKPSVLVEEQDGSNKRFAKQYRIEKIVKKFIKGGDYIGNIGKKGLVRSNQTIEIGGNK